MHQLRAHFVFRFATKYEMMKANNSFPSTPLLHIGSGKELFRGLNALFALEGRGIGRRKMQKLSRCSCHTVSVSGFPSPLSVLTTITGRDSSLPVSPFRRRQPGLLARGRIWRRGRGETHRDESHIEAMTVVAPSTVTSVHPPFQSPSEK